MRVYHDVSVQARFGGTMALGDGLFYTEKTG